MSRTTEPQAIVELLQKRAAQFRKQAAADEEAINMPNGVKEQKASVPAPQENPGQMPENANVDKDDSKDSDFRGLVTGGNPSAGAPNPALSKGAGDLSDRIRRLTDLVKSSTGQEKKGDGPSVTPRAFSQENLTKLASLLLEDEEGLARAKEVIDRRVGADAAESLIKSAQEAYSQLQDLEGGIDKQAAFDAGVEAQQAVAHAMEKSGCTDEDAEQINKMASYHGTYLQKLAAAGNTEEIAFYKQAAMDYGAMAGGEEIPGAEVTPELIEQLLMEAIASGEITEQEAVALLEAILSGGDAGAAPAGAAAPIA